LKRHWTPSEEMSRLPALNRRSEMKPPNQPFSLADATEDEEATEDEVVDADSTAESKAEIAMMTRNTPGLNAKLNDHTTANCGILKRLNSGSRDDQICNYCGKPGHIRPKCRTRQNGFEARNKVNKRSKSDMKATLSQATASLAEHGIAAGD
jgi:hypothetical protein